MAAPPELAAWYDFCDRIRTLGERVLGPEFPNTPSDRPEAIAHLADQLSCWLGWAIGHGDTTAPFFHRSNDLVTQWGGPNQDNAYHHARIDPARRYRIRGQMHSCEEFVLTLRVGFMHMEEWGTKATVTASERGISRGDSFELLLGGDGSDPDWIAIAEDVTTVSLREYYLDWKPEEPAVFTIECLDDVSAPPRPATPGLEAQLDLAIHQIERSIVFWNDYMREHRAKGEDNRFALPMKVAKGLGVARYAFCFWDLAPDDALLIDTDVPDARYWNLQLATLGWFEQVDPVHRITSINQHQARLSTDRRLRLVLAHEDPHVPNWLDTGGRRDGLLTLRWFWPNADPSPETRVLKLEHVIAALPADTPKVDAAERRRDIRARKEHLAWRFRT